MIPFRQWRRRSRHLRGSLGTRLGLAVAVLVLAAASVLSYVTATQQRRMAVEQARELAYVVHQVTLAGLTGMMLTGQAASRAVFLDQIAQAEPVRALRVVRGDAVVAQYGAGAPGERDADAVVQRVIAQAAPEFLLAPDERSMRAVLPAVAMKQYLGKNCLSCHAVREGTVLGAVSMSIGLEKGQASVAAALRRTIAFGVAAAIALLFGVRQLVRRIVIRPLRAMTLRLDRIARGRGDLTRRLPHRRRDEIGDAMRAFNQVLARVWQFTSAEALAEKVFENSPHGLLICDAAGLIRRTNPAFTKVTGYTEAEVLGRNPRLLQSGRQDAPFYASMWASLRDAGHWRGDIWNRKRNGEIYPESLQISAVRDVTGQVTGYVASFADISDRMQAEAIIAHRATHDLLTGLPNRTLLLERLTTALAELGTSESLLAVLFIDLDDFKPVNDQLGHAAGDELLRQVSRRFQLAVRQEDTVARLGGDEFVVLLPHIAEREHAPLVADKITRAVSTPFLVDGHQAVVSVSIGVVVVSDATGDAEELLRRADAAMYAAKGIRGERRSAPAPAPVEVRPWVARVGLRTRDASTGTRGPAA